MNDRMKSVVEAERAEVDQLREALKGATIIANKTGSILREKEAREAALLKALKALRTEAIFARTVIQNYGGNPLALEDAIAEADAILTTTGGASV